MFGILFIASLLFQDVRVTIYNDNIGLVKDTREFELKKGRTKLEFTNVASTIDPTSVGFKAKDVNIVEQNYEYDLINSSKLLEKYTDREITTTTKEGTVYSGTLLSFDDKNLTIKDKSGVKILRRENIEKIDLPEIPEGLITKPTLVWWLDSKRKGKSRCEVSYLAGGLNWHADYVGILEKNEKSMDLSGWVTAENRSGTSYENAKLKVVAGKPHRVEKKRFVPYAKGMRVEAAMAPRFKERAFFEYHIYDLKGKTTLKNNSEKQITFISPTNVRTKKVYIYEGGKNVKVKLKFKNSKSAGLGIPLPMGKVRLYKEDVDKSLEFIGEDRIEHTPKDETVRLYLGDAFDLVGERKVVSTRKIADRVREESYKIKIRNHKKEKVTVNIIEKLWGDWEILKSNKKYEKLDAHTIKFVVDILSDKEAIVTYTARFVW